MPSVDSKTCSKCREVLPAADFYLNPRTSTGLTSWCKPCARKVKSESNRRIKAADPDAYNARRRAYVASYRTRHPERISQAARTRNLQRHYALTPDDYAAMVDAQDGRCAVCGDHPSRRPLAVDHDHATGRNRALLCDRCNVAIGMLRESPLIAQAVAAYLVKWGA